MTAAGSEQGPRQDAAVRRFSGDGTDPETDYRRWRRWSRAYLNVQKAKGIAEDNHGSLLYTLLDGTALATFDSVSMDDIEAPGGHDLLFQVLDERFPEQSTHDKLGKVLDSIFDLKIEKGESTATYTGKVRAAFAAAEAEGIRFPSVAQGYLLLRFLKLSQERKAVVMAAARQSYEEKDVASALRTTYPDNLFVVAKQSANVHVAEASDDDGMVGEELEEDSVLLADYADDDEPIEEQDAIDCLLSWKQTRMGITKEKLNRGFAGGRDFKKLEARVRCFKCKQIGHFSRNCPKRGKGFGKNSSSSSTASTTTGSTKVNFVNVAWPVWSNDFLPFGIKANEPYGLPGPPDSDDDDPTAVEVMHMMDPPEPPLSGHQMESLVRGWEYVPRDYWHCTGSRIVREHVLPRRALFSPGASGCPIPLEDLSNVRVTRTVQEDGTTTTIRTINWRQKGQAHTNLDYEWTGETIFFLRDDQSMDPSFKTQRKGCQTEDLVGDMALKGVVEAESEDEDDGETLAALVHDAGYGVVDTGCGRGLVGEETLARHQEALRQHGLEVEELTHVAHTFKYGNGSSDKSIKRVQLPVFIKGRKMSMRVHVVPGNVPLLISKRFLKSLGAQIDLAANTVVFKQAHVTTELLEKRDGSYQLNLIDVQGPPKTSSLEVDVLEAQDIGATPVEEEESFGEVTYSMANDLVMDENSENDQSGNASSTSSNETEAMEESNETPTGDSNMTADYELAENDGEITNSDENNPETIQDRENEGQRSPMSNETDESDEDDMGVMAVFKAEDRRQVQENLFKTLSQRGDEDTPTVMEIFCPGRFSEMAGACGLKSQGSFDMSDGWDWTVREHRERAEMAVELGCFFSASLENIGRCVGPMRWADAAERAEPHSEINHAGSRQAGTYQLDQEECHCIEGQGELQAQQNFIGMCGTQELELNQSNFEAVGTQAAVLAGFAVCMLAKIDVPDSINPVLMALYYAFAVVNLMGNLACVSENTHFLVLRHGYGVLLWCCDHPRLDQDAAFRSTGMLCHPFLGIAFRYRDHEAVKVDDMLSSDTVGTEAFVKQLGVDCDTLAQLLVNIRQRRHDAKLPPADNFLLELDFHYREKGCREVIPLSKSVVQVDIDARCEKPSNFNDFFFGRRLNCRNMLRRGPPPRVVPAMACPSAQNVSDLVVEMLGSNFC
eukprot:g17343.t1